MKKVIVLFGHKAVIEAAKSLELYTINVLENDMLQHTFLNAAKISDETIVLKDLNRLEDTVKNLLKLHEVETIVSFTDTREGVKRASEFCEKYLPRNSFVSSNSVEKLLNKRKMRELLEDIEQIKIANIVPKSQEDFNKFLADNGDSILKPIMGQASTGVVLVSADCSYEDLSENEKNGIKQGDYILEEFISGEEYSAESITVNGTTKVLGITKKYKIPEGNQHSVFVEMGHSFPTFISESVNSKIEKLVINLFNSLDICNTIGHTEVIVRNEQPYVVESHLRAGGDCIPDLIEKVTGFCPYKMLFMAIIGLQQPEIVFNKQASIRYFIPEKIGRIESVEFKSNGLDFSTSIKNRLDFSEKEVLPINDSFDRKWGFAISHSENSEKTLLDFLEQYNVIYND